MPEESATIFVQNHTVTVSALRDQVVGTIANAVGIVVQGAADDVLKYATAITDSLVIAQAEVDAAKRDALVKELLGQLGLLAELNRVRASETGFETLRQILSVSSGVLSGVLAAFGQGLGAAAAGAVSHALGGTQTPATGG